MSRIKVLTISDHPLFNSGVAHTMRNIILALLKSDKFDIISLGGGIKHAEYKPQRLEEWKERWTIYPVDGFGDKQIVRSVLRQEKIDIVLFQSDPRFFTWLLEMENEIRPLAPMVWYGIWDNYPYPKFNEPIWSSVDVFASISKVTYDLVNNVAPSVENHYIPHAVDNAAFKKHDKAIVKKFADANFKHLNDGRFVVFWNNRNARRKQSGSLVYWFNKFLDKIGREKACLLMHTNPLDPNGQNLYDVARDCGLSNTEISFSTGQLTAEALGLMYNFADVTINIADAEGFGLTTLESLSCGTPIIVNMTGGLQEQVTDGENWFGIGIEPASRAIIGSQEIPYIFEDRVSEKDVVNALYDMYKMGDNERERLGRHGQKHVRKNYSYEQYNKSWVELLTKVHNERGSWPTKGFQGWELKTY